MSGLRCRLVSAAFLLLVFCPELAFGQSREQAISLNGIDLFYSEYGEGEPLLLLHGYGFTGDMWEPLVPELSRHFRVIVPDLRGHGRSTDPEHAFTHRQAALDLHALLDSLELNPVMGIGYATGAMTLLHFATQRPARTKAMILLGAGHYWPENVREMFRRSTFERQSAERLQQLRERHAGGDEQISALIEKFHSFHDDYHDVNFTPPYLATITARTLVVHGDRDDLFPVDMAFDIYRSIPDASLLVVPDLGHGLTFPLMAHDTSLGQFFRDTVLRFLDGGMRNAAGSNR